MEDERRNVVPSRAISGYLALCRVKKLNSYGNEREEDFSRDRFNDFHSSTLGGIR